MTTTVAWAGITCDAMTTDAPASAEPESSGIATRPPPGPIASPERYLAGGTWPSSRSASTYLSAFESALVTAVSAFASAAARLPGVVAVAAALRAVVTAARAFETAAPCFGFVGGRRSW